MSIKSIIIIRVYNRNYSLVYNINEIEYKIYSIIQLKNEKVVCTSYDITIIQLNKQNYEIFQIIKSWTNKIIELCDNKFIGIQNSNIRFYSINNNKYILSKDIKIKKNINNIIKIKENELCLLLDNYFKNFSVNILDIESKKIKFKFIEIKNKQSGEMCLIENKYLVVSFYLYLILIDIEKYKVISKISTSFGCVNTFCVWNNFTFFSGDDIGDIIEWKINNNKIVKVKEYNNGKKPVKNIIKFNNNLIAACSNDGFIKFYDID